MNLAIEYYEGKLPLPVWEVTDWESDHACDNLVVYVVLSSLIHTLANWGWRNGY